jgi:hypothetical protein
LQIVPLFGGPVYTLTTLTLAAPLLFGIHQVGQSL